MARILSDIAFCLGFDSYSSTSEACCSVILGQCCCLCCIRCLRAQRRAAHAIAARDTKIVVLAPSSLAAASIIGRSFAGTKNTEPEWGINWALGPQLKDLEDPHRFEVSRFWMSFALQEYGNRGTVLAAKHEGAPDGLGAVLIAQRYDGAPAADLTQCLSENSVVTRYLCTGMMPKVYTARELKGILLPLETRLEKGLMPTMKKCHQENAPGPHWYVAVMAVDPSAQGAKHCSRLMRAVCAQADADGIPVYLECNGPRNKAVYERFGFRCVQTYTLKVPQKGDEEGWSPYEHFFAMVRPSNGGDGGVVVPGYPAAEMLRES